MVLSSETVLDLDSAVKAIAMSESVSSPPSYGSAETESLRSLRSVDSLHEEIIRSALERNGNNRKKTAEELGISTSTLYRKMKGLGIEF